MILCRPDSYLDPGAKASARPANCYSNKQEAYLQIFFHVGAFPGSMPWLADGPDGTILARNQSMTAEKHEKLIQKISKEFYSYID